MHLKLQRALSFGHYNTTLQRPKLKGHKELHRSEKKDMIEPVTDKKKNNDFTTLYFIYRDLSHWDFRADIIMVYYRT